MAEYIERESLLSMVKPDDPSDENNAITISTAKTLIRSLAYRIPAADVAPVRHGRWIEREKYTFGVMYDCSICGNRILDTGHSWNYCPKCGARMDGVHDG